MRLIHYSDEPLTSVRDVEQAGEKYEWHDGRKPVGLWVSVEGSDDWASWCASEQFGDIASQHATLVRLHENHRVLILDTSDAMQIFHQRYGYRSEIMRSQHSARVDWPAVSRDHDGVVIAPYQPEHRLWSPLSGWYYTWDCASGCIWRGRAVQALRALESKKSAA